MYSVLLVWLTAIFTLWTLMLRVWQFVACTNYAARCIIECGSGMCKHPAPTSPILTASFMAFWSLYRLQRRIPSYDSKDDDMVHVVERIFKYCEQMSPSEGMNCVCKTTYILQHAFAKVIMRHVTLWVCKLILTGHTYNIKILLLSHNVRPFCSSYWSSL